MAIPSSSVLPVSMCLGFFSPSWLEWQHLSVVRLVTLGMSQLPFEKREAGKQEWVGVSIVLWKILGGDQKGWKGGGKWNGKCAYLEAGKRSQGSKAAAAVQWRGAVTGMGNTADEKIILGLSWWSLVYPDTLLILLWKHFRLQLHCWALLSAKTRNQVLLRRNLLVAFKLQWCQDVLAEVGILCEMQYRCEVNKSPVQIWVLMGTQLA